jgi:hypothetical protein
VQETYAAGAEVSERYVNVGSGKEKKMEKSFKAKEQEIEMLKAELLGKESEADSLHKTMAEIARKFARQEFKLKGRINELQRENAAYKNMHLFNAGTKGMPNARKSKAVPSTTTPSDDGEGCTWTNRDGERVGCKGRVTLHKDVDGNMVSLCHHHIKLTDQRIMRLKMKLESAQAAGNKRARNHRQPVNEGGEEGGGPTEDEEDGEEEEEDNAAEGGDFEEGIDNTQQGRRGEQADEGRDGREEEGGEVGQNTGRAFHPRASRIRSKRVTRR